MIDVKQAVNSAFESIIELYDKDELVDLALEEVELSDDESTWFVTLGFTRYTKPPQEPLKALQSVMTAPKAERVYKVFEIDAESGDMEAIKIRQP